MKRIHVWPSPFGSISAIWEDGDLIGVEFAQRIERVKDVDAEEHRFGRELAEYFEGKRKSFSAEIRPEGTPFQRAVWKQLLRIPYGETRTYSDIARAIGRPEAHRAVGNAVGKNPLAIVIPCHRVVRSDGTLGGFSGGEGIKPLLLKLEGVSQFSDGNEHASRLPEVPGCELGCSCTSGRRPSEEHPPPR